MASGDIVVYVLETIPLVTTSAALVFRAGGSTPAEQYRLYAFDATAIEYIDYRCKLHGYDGGGLTLRLYWSAAGTATSGNVVWNAAIRRIADDAEDVDVSHTYDYNTVTATAPTVNGEVDYTSITFTDGADMDSWADGELAIIRVRREATNGSDTMNTDDAELWAISGEET